jgi:tetratricopeptide (TPR) repeat protein
VIFRKVYPHDHPTVAFVLNQIGFWLTISGDYEEAERDIQEALAMRLRLLGERHPSIGSSQIVLATLEVAQHRYLEALESAGKAIDIYTATLSVTHWRTAAAMSAQGAAFTGLSRYAEAEQALTRSAAILSKDGGAPPVFRTLNERYLDTLHRLEHRPRLALSATPGQ